MLELLKQFYATERRLRDKLDAGRLDDESFTATRAVIMGLFSLTSKPGYSARYERSCRNLARPSSIVRSW